MLYKTKANIFFFKLYLFYNDNETIHTTYAHARPGDYPPAQLGDNITPLTCEYRSRVTVMRGERFTTAPVGHFVYMNKFLQQNKNVSECSEHVLLVH